jgi:hypothetical protein
MLSKLTKPRPRITITLKCPSTTLQPTLSRDTTPTPRSIILHKTSRLKIRSRTKGERKVGRNQSNEPLGHGNNCSARFVTNWIVHPIISKQLLVNIVFCINPTFFYLFRFYWILMFKLLIVLLIIASCCCWVLYRWWFSRPLVYQFLLGVVDTKLERRRLITACYPTTYAATSYYTKTPKY